MSSNKRRAIDIRDRNNVRSHVGRMWLLGYGFDMIAGESDLDFDTVRRLAKECQAQWAAEIEDVNQLRDILSKRCDEVYRRAVEWADKAAPRNRSALLRVAISAIQAKLDVTGLRSMQVQHNVSGFVAVVRDLAAMQDTVEGEIRELPSEAENE